MLRRKNTYPIYLFGVLFIASGTRAVNFDDIAGLSAQVVCAPLKSIGANQMLNNLGCYANPVKIGYWIFGAIIISLLVHFVTTRSQD